MAELAIETLIARFPHDTPYLLTVFKSALILPFRTVTTRELRETDLDPGRMPPAVDPCLFFF
jgi:hypothetical protein